MDAEEVFIEDGEEDYDDDSEGDIDLDDPETAINTALNFGLSTDAIAARRIQEEMGEQEDIYGPPPPPPETQQERLERKIREPAIKKGSPVKLPAHAVEKGRKMVQDKLEEDQLLERASLADKIQKYYKFFPHIKENAPKKGKISSADTLKLLQQEFIRCERELNNSNTYESIKKADVIFSYMAEKVFCMFGQNAGMYTVVAKESQHVVEQELKEFSIKYGDMFSMGPEWRYMFKKLQIMMTVIENNNRGMAGATEQVDPAQEALLKNKYANL
jgi:hypothetical protein